MPWEMKRRMNYESARLPASAEQVGQELTRFIMSEACSCIGAKTACARRTLVHRHYPALADRQASIALHADLTEFALKRDEIHELFATFAATFDSPLDVDEEKFEWLVWEQLKLLHAQDRVKYQWAPGVDSDPTSERFAYSVAEQAFFVVGLHRNSSRLTRRFSWPALVFNSHVQFDRMKEGPMYSRIQREVRRRELALQGSLNPNLAEFGERSEAAQYSGRAVPSDWTCPFRPDEAEREPGGTQERRGIHP
ncbi:MAG TPA: guanitoxin biosynthesis heme-dependent pre-guanitoxin N-hydroxylase GntA [Streptosporangiaceae bacterium]|nr:guanitoxin biosynthesis heme-dependent pre-guanitoxin N-hydroxylase GntA [Streptosporangiaceae bacterium]